MLHYTTHKHATSTEWVTFIHGAGGSSSIWFKQIRAFARECNVLLLDLRGHGKSPSIDDATSGKYSFDILVEDIIGVMDAENIRTSHFVGVSLGTILIRHLSELHPDRVDSMILSGAIVKLNFRSRFLMRFGWIFKSVVPYLWLYRFFAHIIMPRKNHREARSLFVREAKKLCQKEFLRWYTLTSKLRSALKLHRQVEVKLPTLYIMGSEDYMFLPGVRELVQRHIGSELYEVPNCGHVVNVEQPTIFNERSVEFIQRIARG